MNGYYGYYGLYRPASPGAWHTKHENRPVGSNPVFALNYRKDKEFLQGKLFMLKCGSFPRKQFTFAGKWVIHINLIQKDEFRKDQKWPELPLKIASSKFLIDFR